MKNNIVYHTRLATDDRTKCSGGSFGGSLDAETANRLVRANFSVVIKPSGRAVFVDRFLREVKLYISVDPLETDAGKAAMAQHNEELALREAALEDKERQIEDLLNSLPAEHRQLILNRIETLASLLQEPTNS